MLLARLTSRNKASRSSAGGEPVVQGKETDSMRKYEVTYILSPNLGDEVVTGLQEAYSQSVVQNGGKVIEVRSWGKRRFAYEIAGHKEGTYVTMRFDAEPETAMELRRQMSIADEVLRSLFVKLN